MDAMPIEQKQSFMKTMQILENFIQKRTHTDLVDNLKLKVVNSVGEEIEILTAADAKKYKAYIQSRLDMERLYQI